MELLRPGAPRTRRAAPLLPVTLLALVAPLALGGCGGSGLATRHLPGPGSVRLNPIYDVTVAYPDLTIVVDGLTRGGVSLDLSIEFSDGTVRDGDPSVTAVARVNEVVAGGVRLGYTLLGRLDIDGSLAEGILHTGYFGPIQVGTANLIPDLFGSLLDGGRRVEGEAVLFGLANRGRFTAVKRRRYLVAGSEAQTYGQASIITVRYDTIMSIEHNVEVTSGDPVARVTDGRPFIVNQLTFDNLQGLDPASFRASFQFSTGGGSNPNDVVIPPAADDGTGTIAFLTRYEAPYNDVALLDLGDGAVIDRIDMTPYAAADRLPRPHKMLLHDGLLYVTLQDVNAGFTRFGLGKVAVIDPRARAVVDIIDLQGQNPFQSIVASTDTGLIYLGMAGIFQGLLDQALTGGIEAIDPETRRSLGLLVDDDDLGGNVSAVAVTSGTRGYCVVSDASYHNYVKAFDPATGEILGTVFDSASYIATIASDGDGYLLIADASFFAPRVLILDGSTGALVATVAARLPSFSFAVLTRSL